MELSLSLPSGPQRLEVVGPAERHLKMLRQTLGVAVTARGETLKLSGDSRSVGRAARALERLIAAVQQGQPLSRQEWLDTLTQDDERDHHHHGKDIARPLTPEALDVYHRGRNVRPMTPGQRSYIEAILEHDLTFCCGPAGTGKTYLAVAAAVALLKRGAVRKLVLARPAVEAGEKLGFLPGDMQAKVNPYLRPLLDGLHDMMDFEQMQRFMAVDVIEVAPLAFMRGRTLNEALIVLDEAQNTTKAQMLMLLTRLGRGSKMIITGDTTQIDLPDPRQSGLVDAVRRLRRVPGIALVTLGRGDIVRHSLVQRIVRAYGPAKGTADEPDAGNGYDGEPA